MKTLSLAIFMLFIASMALSQEVIYTISASKDDQTTRLDSILFENLDNQTKFVVGNLPELPAYDIDLSVQLLVTSVEQVGLPVAQVFRLIRNTPGEVSVQYSGKMLENVILSIYNMAGQRMFTQNVNVLSQNEVINISIPSSGVYLLSIGTTLGSVNYRAIGSAKSLQGTYNLSTTQHPAQNINTAPISTTLKSSPLSDGFSYQVGDSIRVTAFLDEYFTYPHGTRITGSESIDFSMMKSTAESTGVSDTYNPVADGSYNILEYDTISGGTRFVLLTDTVELRTGNILTLDLDTIGVIQKVISIQEINGKTIVETEPGYMDELFIDAAFNLDTRLIEPKSAINKDSSPQDIIKALTDDRGFIHPVKVIYYSEEKTYFTWSAFEDHPDKEHRENIINFHEDFSGTDLYGKKGQNIHFYIDQGYSSLKADAVFEFDFKYDGEITEDTKVKRGDLEFFKFYLDADAGFQTKLALDMNRSREEKNTERIFRLAKVTAKFVVPPGIPVWITFGVDVYSDFHFKADASLHANWGFESNHSLQAGGIYTRATNDFSPIYSYVPENIIYPLNIEGEVNAYTRFEIFPRADIRLYGFFGPFAEIVPYVQGEYNAKFQSQITSSGHETFLAWNSGIDLGLDLRVGTSLRFLLYSRDFSLPPINCFNWTLWKSPAELILLTELPDQIQAGETIQLQVKVADHLNNPAPLTPVYFEGDGVFSKQLQITGVNGIVTLNWTPGQTTGSKSFSATIYRADKTVITTLSGSTNIAGSAPVAAFSGTPTSGTAPLTVSFTDQSTNNPTSWSWNFGDGTTSTQRNPSKTFNNPGVYNVSLTATNSHGSITQTKNSYITVTQAGSGDNTQVVDVTNPTTGKTWMDRNLGASRAATSSTDTQAHGDLYQWGRAADGHQKRNSGTTSTRSGSDTPGHGNFILAPNSPYDWRSPQEPNLWQGVNGVNNPCPPGYRLPTEAELNAERLSWSSNSSAGAFASPLKLPVAGGRSVSNGSLGNVGSYGYYWSSTVDGIGSRGLYFGSTGAGMYDDVRAGGYSVRCLKDYSTIPTKYNLNLDVTPAGAGEVSGAGAYEAGEVVSIEAVANSGWTFVEWTGDTDYIVNPKAANTTVTMPAQNISLEAYFKKAGDPETGTFTDTRDGQTYKWVKIGDQVWMAENLRATKYNNGDAIPTGLSDTEWETTEEGAYAIFPHDFDDYEDIDVDGIDSDEEMVDAYGKLYNWYAIHDPRGLCPAGWRVPNNEIWDHLETYLMHEYNLSNDFYDVESVGNALKAARQVNHPWGEEYNTEDHPRWTSHNTHYGTDLVGFAAFPGGLRSSSGQFDSLGYSGYWWSSTSLATNPSCGRFIFYSPGFLGEGCGDVSEGGGISVRCIRNID